jgi:DNA invertase Pin-like site-specific DNA recombinase
VVAEAERKMISARTKAALAAAKAKGKKLGGFRGRAGTREDCAAATRALVAKAAARAQDLAPIINRLDPDGSLALRQLAAKLMEEGVPTTAGSAVWTAAGVARLRARLTAA